MYNIVNHAWVLAANRHVLAAWCCVLGFYMCGKNVTFTVWLCWPEALSWANGEGLCCVCSKLSKICSLLPYIYSIGMRVCVCWFLPCAMQCENPFGLAKMCRGRGETLNAACVSVVCWAVCMLLAKMWAWTFSPGKGILMGICQRACSQLCWSGGEVEPGDLDLEASV